MEGVAAEAGVTKPVLCRYFQDKSALVDATGERGSTRSAWPRPQRSVVKVGADAVNHAGPAWGQR